MNTKFKLITASVALSMLATSLVGFGGSANAQPVLDSNVEFVLNNNNITDFVLINESLDNYEYTYEQNGEMFKVIENTDSSFKKVNSSIYKKDTKGNFELIIEREMTFESNQNGEIIVTTTENNSTSQEVVSVSSTSSPSRTQKQDNGSITINNSYLTGWKSDGSTNYTNNIVAYTVIAISALIANTVPWAPAKWLNTVAAAIYLRNTSTIYYTQFNWGRYLLASPLTQIADRRTVYVYSDSARTNQVGDPVTREYYTPGWGPNGPL
ncbi:hypothetical protein [Paenibacillus sp. 2KB_22]|uniref:hypothetical protein n=1 Tax=Paenibacillus sp. 2KB_22 TaxID=3232978 RepID=UPI003F955B7C